MIARFVRYLDIVVGHPAANHRRALPHLVFRSEVTRSLYGIYILPLAFHFSDMIFKRESRWRVKGVSVLPSVLQMSS